ncbi:MAG TPA: protein-glutamate O-methyltransferase CheR [Candidatus Methylacidiphilales bacterium]
MISQAVTLELEEFHFIREFIYRMASIVIEEDKHYLVEYRLTPLIEREGMRSFRHLVSELRQPSSALLRSQVVAAMTTNETYFFRDARPFDVLRRVILPQLIERRRAARSLHLFFGGCSSGQEPCSVAMLLRHDFPELADWNLRLTAIDISGEMIRRARAGRYSQFEVNRGLPARMLVKYFQKEGIDWQISPEIRSMIDFQEMNLMQAFEFCFGADLIFLRNVLIYFDQNFRGQLLESIERSQRPDGCLMLGAAETTVFSSEAFLPLPVEHSNMFYLKNTPAPFSSNPSLQQVAL